MCFHNGGRELFEKYTPSGEGFGLIEPPLTKSVVKVTEDGQVFYEDKLLERRYSSKGWVVDVEVGERVEEMEVAFLSLLAFQKLKIEQWYWESVELFYIDGDDRNIHPSNIGYRYLRKIVCDKQSGFYRIPFFSRYSVSPRGVVFDRELGRVVKPSILKGCVKRNRKGGYHHYSLISDCGKHGLGGHRLVGLALLRYPDNVDSLHINHIDGNPGNNHFLNLEWVTPLENNLHAVRSGLKTQNIVCFAKNCFSGEELEFFSMEEATRVTGVTWLTLRDRIVNKSQAICRHGWIFKPDMETPWREVSDPQAELDKTQAPVKVKLYNVFTKEESEHETMGDALQHMGMQRRVKLDFRKIRKKDRPYHGWLFRFDGDETPWPEFTDKALAIFRDNPINRAIGVTAVNDKGESLFFTNVKKAAEYFNNTLGKASDVYKAIARKRIVEGYSLNYYDPMCPLSQ